MPLTITDDQLARIDLTPEQLRLEIAVMLRERDRMTYRAAAALAGMPPGEFVDLLRERGVPFIHVGGTTEEEAATYIRQEFGWPERLAELPDPEPPAPSDSSEADGAAPAIATSGRAAA